MTPVLKLAQEIGVSDVALARACRKANIPLPARGHWAIPIERRPDRPKLPKARRNAPGRAGPRFWTRPIDRRRPHWLPTMSPES